MMKKIFNIIFILSLFAFYACEEADKFAGVDPEDAGIINKVDLRTILSRRNDVTLFLRAVDKAGIGNTLTATDSVTLFVPNDVAFQAFIEAAGFQVLDDVPAEVLSNILRYHIISGNRLAASLNSGRINTLQGSSLLITRSGNNVFVNGESRVITSNLRATNGVAHIVNLVLNIPQGNLLEVIENDPDFSTLKAAIELAGIEELFTGTSSYTIFAPTNAAFAALGIDLSTLDTETLIEILAFHVLNNDLTSVQLPTTGNLTSILGNETDDNRQLLRVAEGRVNGAAIVKPNIIATNGVIHKVSSVILKGRTIIESLGPGFNPYGANDAVSLDLFGNIVAGSGYTRFDSVVNRSTVYIQLFSPVYDDFPNNEAAINYIESRTFQGTVRIPTLANGTKITSINGSSYYVVTDASGRRYVNGTASNAFQNQATVANPMYDGVVYLFNSLAFNPLPAKNMLEVISEIDEYSLFAAAVVAAGKESVLSGGNRTLFIVNNAAFTEYTGISDPEVLAGLSAAGKEFLAEVIDRHVVENVYFSRHVASFIPTLKNRLNEDVFFATVSNELVIVLDPKRPASAVVGLNTVDILAANGVIHEISDVMEFPE
ncbi:MAG: fasciclin domain-containing protein [Cyclobacteriaceae bacterium]|nr:fasciclin domain-containing protein [Cyclobacteriaceae bacterium]